MSHGQWRGWALPAALALLALGPSCTPAPTHPGAGAKQGTAREVPDERAIPVGLLAPSVLPSGVPLEADDTIWGSPNAPVTVVAFLDYECPFSARAFPTVRTLQQAYGPERLRVVLKHLPLDFHENAVPAAIALQAVRELGGQEAALGYAALLLDNQHQLDQEHLASMAEEVGVDGSEFRSRLGSPHLLRAVRNDIELAIQLGINGTPTFRINGAPLVGAQPLEAFKDVIEREFAATNKLAEERVEPQEIYPKRVEANQSNGNSEEPPSIYRVPLADSPRLGPDDALVTIVEFSDFECPFCRQVLPTLEKLRERFPKDVRFVFKHLPLDFHERALPAARVAATIYEQGGDDAFWSATERLFEGSLDDDQLLDVARSQGVPEKLAEGALEGNAGQQTIDRDLNLADDLGARGTPHFFINGRRLIGARPYAEFERMVLEAITAAKPVLDSGVLPSAYYEHLMATADPLGGPKKTAVRFDAENRPTRGPADAPVSLHVFSDFECPYCASVEPTLAEIRQKFPKEVRIVWHNLPLAFHRHARLAAAAGLEAFAQKGNSAFWRLHDSLYESHQRDDGPDLERASLVALARQIGLDVQRFERALDDGRHDDAIEADLALARAAGIDGTPGFVINGWMTTGARPLRYFTALVRRALAKDVAESKE